MKQVIKWAIDVSFRPPKCMYDNKTAARVITHGKEVFIRNPVNFLNQRKHMLCGSIWTDRNYPNPKHCLIYLHSLSTNQLECLNLVPFIVCSDIALFCFDFPGCGISGGDYIPLDGSGVCDVIEAVSFLDKTYHFDKYALWGRSMGASIALHTASTTRKFSCVVSDAAYQNIESVVRDQAVYMGIPSLVLSIFEPIAKKIVSSEIGSDISNLYPLSEVPFAQTPLLMGHGRQDNFVTLKQAQRLYDNYGCTDKQLYIFDARHNTRRPFQWYESASRFVFRRFGLVPNKRFYDAVYHESRIHSGDINKILADIDVEIKEANKKELEKLEKTKREAREAEASSGGEAEKKTN